MKSSNDIFSVSEHLAPITEPNVELRIIALAYHLEDEKSFYEVEYQSVRGETKTKLIPRELFLKPSAVADILLSGDADIQDPVESIKAALSVKPERKFEITRRTGWHDDKNFIYPKKTFGPRKNDLLYCEPEKIDPALGLRSGSLEAWSDGLRQPCKHSDYALFAASVAAGSSLLDIIGLDEGAVFHFHGTEGAKPGSSVKTKSSSGKTLVTRIGISTVGRCKKTDLATFAITQRAVEDFCSSHNHLVAALDEEGRAPDGGPRGTRATTNLAYVIPGGRGTVRSNKATRDHNLRNVSWAVLAISNGENPLDASSTLSSRPEGAQTRMICIPVPPGRDGGIFNLISGNQSKITEKSKRLARQVEQAVAENYGVAMPAFLRELVRKRSALQERVRRIIDLFIVRVEADSDPWERRFAEKFGIVLTGAILMADFNIGPWTKRQAWRSVKRLYKKARGAIVSIEDATDTFVGSLRHLIKDKKRFPVVKKGEESAGNSWGLVRKMSDGSYAILIRLSRFEKLVEPTAVSRQVLTELEKRNILIKAADGKQTRQIMIAGSKVRQRYVCLDRRALRAQ